MKKILVDGSKLLVQSFIQCSNYLLASLHCEPPESLNTCESITTRFQVQNA
jgi:hypothetical protein